MPIIASEMKEIDTPGRHLTLEDYPAVITGEGVLILEQVQPAGKKPMPGPVFLHGAREWI
jgi:methionyl-tRNA formyltransferase